MIKKSPYILFVFICIPVLTGYVCAFGLGVEHSQSVIPHGDQFVYITQLFKLIDAGKIDYLSTLLLSFQENWYWLYRFSVSIFSPFLVKEPFSIFFINYIFLGIASISLGRLAIRLSLPFNRTLFLSLVFLLPPWIYGHWTTLSLFALQLETSFYWILTIATIHLIIYSLEPKNPKNALIAGLFTGLAVWGRGNSLPYVLIILAFPAIAIGYRAIRTKSRRILYPAIYFLMTFGVLSGLFYFSNLEKILWYYGRGFGNMLEKEGGAFSYIFTNLTQNFPAIIWTIKNFPGIFIARNPNSPPTIFLSLFCHLLVVFSLIITTLYWKKRPNRKRRLIFHSNLTGSTLYLGNLILGIFLFSKNMASGELLVFFPMLLMLVGLMIIGFSIAAIIFLITSKNLKPPNPVITGFILVFFIGYGFLLSKKSTPLQQNEKLPSPYYVEAFSRDLSQITENKLLTILWYGKAYNIAIINYYRQKWGLPPIETVSTTRDGLFFFENLPNDTYNKVMPIEEFRRRLRSIIYKSDFLIIPEDIRKYDYMLGNPGLAKRREILKKFLNSPDSPPFAVKMILSDTNSTRLLLLQRINDGAKPTQMDFLKLPYGENFDSLPSEYPNVIKFDESSIQTERRFPTYLLFDEDPNTFWETQKTPPYIVTIKTSKPRRVSTYSLLSGNHSQSNRMPVKWVLQGSHDGDHWNDIDHVQLAQPWKDNTKKLFPVKQKEFYEFYRFIFLKTLDAQLLRLYEIKLYETTETDDSNELNNWDFYTWESNGKNITFEKPAKITPNP